MALVFHGKPFFSLPEVAERLGVTRLTVYRWIHGTRRAPGDIPLDDIIRDTRSRQTYVPEAIVRQLRDTLRNARAAAKGRSTRR